MPALRKPTEVLRLNGALERNPGRYADRAGEPAPTKQIGPPPDHLTKEERAAWKRIVKIAPPGVLFNSDEITVELVARLYARSKTEILKAAELSLLRTMLGSLGLTPADRTRLNVKTEVPEPQDGWGDL